MNDPDIKTVKLMRNIFFAVAFIFLINEIFQIHLFLYLLGPVLLIILMLLYYLSSVKRNLMYFIALCCSFIANIFFLEMVHQPLVYGLLAYLIYRLATIILVYRAIKTKKLPPLIIATLPFLCLVLYLINLTQEALGESLYPAIIIGILTSVLGGFSLSSYIFDDNKKNSWLIISSLLFVVQYFIFGIQKFYLWNEVFQPIASAIYAISHYTFYKFLIMDENQKYLAAKIDAT